MAALTSTRRFGKEVAKAITKKPTINSFQFKYLATFTSVFTKLLLSHESIKQEMTNVII
jgi:hypothetical protein